MGSNICMLYYSCLDPKSLADRLAAFVGLSHDFADIFARVAGAWRVEQVFADLFIARALVLHGFSEGVAHGVRFVGADMLVADISDGARTDRFVSGGIHPKKYCAPT